MDLCLILFSFSLLLSKMTRYLFTVSLPSHASGILIVVLCGPVQFISISFC